MKSIISVTLLLSIQLYSDSYSFSPGVKPVNSATYTKECASCHFGFQPGLLPQRSWKKVMVNLEEHFGVDAWIDKKSNQDILSYLLNGASDMSKGYKRSRKIDASIPFYRTPVRISRTPYFIKEHREIPLRLIKQEEVKSIANCSACHTRAESGFYSERFINIPNYGQWDD